MPPRRSARLETAKATLRDSLAQLPATGSEAPHSTGDGDDDDDDMNFDHTSDTNDSQPTGGETFQQHVHNLARRADISSDCFKGQRESTPFDPRTAKSNTVHRDSLVQVIGGPTTSSDSFVCVTLRCGFSSRDIHKWICSPEARGIYIPKSPTNPKPMWRLPLVAKKEKPLYRLFLLLIKGILGKFVSPGLDDGVKRKAHDVNNVNLTHKDGKQYTSPDLVVCGTESYLETPSDGSSVGYSNMITFFEVKRDKVITWSIHLKQMTIYAQQIFAHQPNRLFVEGMLISEKRFQIVQFDRAGVQVTPFMDLNERPMGFVSAIVNLCGGKGSRVRFDDSIQWVSIQGKKITGTMKYGPPGQEEILDLVNPQPIAHSIDIRGRANTLWVVKRRTTKEIFFVKDSWMSEGRTSEQELLEKTRSILGIGEMASFQARMIRTKDFRCKDTLGAFSDRQAARIMLKPYGREIHAFTDILQVLRALHDVVCAHLGLFTANILHRDISNKNVLLGKKGAKEGWRGILIDLGAALDFGPNARNHSGMKEARSGTRFFQSCMILRFLTGMSVGEAPPHDHLDDLEGIFLLTCFLMFQYHHNGEERNQDDQAREVVSEWDSESPKISLARKLSFLDPRSGMKDGAAAIIRKSWGPACATLFKSYWKWVCEIQHQKTQILEELSERAEEINGQSGPRQSGPMKGEDSDMGERRGEEDYFEDKDDAYEGNEGNGAEDNDADDGGAEEGSAGENGLSEDEAEDEEGDPEGEDEDEDKDKFVTVGDLFNPTVFENQVPLGQGVFAPLMDSAGDHYRTVLQFFSVAIASIESDPEGQGPPPVQKQAIKRKSPSSGGHGNTKKAKDAGGSRPKRS